MTHHIDTYTLSKLITGQPETEDWAAFSSADWTHLLQAAQREGVGPLLYWQFTRSGKIASLPPKVQIALRLLYASSWKQNQKILTELELLSRLFDQAGIPVVVLKGACFALTIYTDVGLRPMGDLDLLVPKEKLSEAVDIANSGGYIDALPDASPGLRDLLSHEVCLQKTGEDSITLEIHHSLVADKSFLYSVSVDWFWSQVELLGGGSRGRFSDIYMLTPTAQVLYAASHAMLQHGGRNSPLRWYYDLDQLIRFYAKRIDWELLLSQASIFEWGSALDAALTQTQNYFDTPIPKIVRVRLTDLNDRHQSLVALLRNKPATHTLEEGQKLLSLNWVGRFRLLSALIAPSPAYMRWRYKLKSPWALPFYYLIRWGVIFQDMLRTGISFLRKSQRIPRNLTEKPSSEEKL